MKKGVVHILEAILVSLTFLITVPILLYPSLARTDWSYAQLNLMGQDLMASLDKIIENKESFLQNIMEINATELKNSINEKFDWIKRKKINYGIKSLGAIKNEIRVGFNCTSCDTNEEVNEIENILKPSYVNGRFVYFRVFPFSYDNFQRYDIDVLLIMGGEQRNEANNRINDLKQLSEKGVGFVGFYNISSLDQIENYIFGLSSLSGSNNGNLTFVNSFDAIKPNYEIQKYFYGIGINENFTYKLNENDETFMILWENNYLVRRNDTDSDGIYDALDIDTNHDGSYELFGKKEGEWFIINNGNDFNFTIEKIDPEGNFFTLNFERKPEYVFDDFLKDDTIRVTSDKSENYVVLKNQYGEAGLVINGTRNSPWRSVWISNGKGDDINALVKSAIVWASEKKWWNVLRTVSGSYSKISYFVSQGEEFHEPYWIEMNLWHIY